MELLKILTACSLLLFVGGAVLLFVLSKGIHARGYLGFIMLLWSVGAALMLISMLRHGHVVAPGESFALFQLLVGSSLTIVTLSYYLEVLRPGWLSWRRFGIIAVPYLLVLVVYFVVLAARGEGVARLESVADLHANLGRFNVWYRFVIFGTMMVYHFLIFWVVIRFQAQYNRWCRENFSSSEPYKISWIFYSGATFVGMATVFLFMLINRTHGVLVWHQVCLMVTFGFLLYKTLRHDNPYPEGFFKHALDDVKAEEISERAVCEGGNFDTLLPGYKLELEEWLVSKKPYLNPEFKLSDVSEVLPMNRSYLSRVFNEGYGVSFSQVVQNLRLKEAERLLIEDKHLKINEIASKCGFLSHSTFHRAFVSNYGITPKQFREIC